MQLEVGAGEVDLAQTHGSCPVGACSHQLVVQVLGERLTRLIVLGEGGQRVLVVAPVDEPALSGPSAWIAAMVWQYSRLV